MQDYILRGTAMNNKVRVFAVLSTQIVEELRGRHHTTPVTTAAMGRTVSIGAMMGAMLKNGQRLTIQVKGDGPIGEIVVDANSNGEVRGYVKNPHVDLPLNEKGKLDVRGAVGSEGFIYVVKDFGMKEPYRGSTPIISGEIGDDFTYYFSKSEQIPSIVAVGVLIDRDSSVKISGGFIIQVLPGIEDEDINQIEEKIASVRSVTSLLEQGSTLESIIEEIVGPLHVLEQSGLVFKCRCSHERVEQTLISLGQQELDEILEEDGQAEIVCDFCNERYFFSGEQIGELIDKLKSK
ncbi:MAG: Hsp33 family molecular chaperone [Paenibacillus sp. RIFOXYA1_FULL_44_5]|nr:MAG: Hsp33 family molecular chaperone [Paenibacillus sp. RIFOXYA1_FULL_44_5]